MTWEGSCGKCRNLEFDLTVNNDHLVYVNCTYCHTLVGTIPAASQINPPVAEPH
jgi:hypothetical protein